MENLLRLKLSSWSTGNLLPNRYWFNLQGINSLNGCDVRFKFVPIGDDSDPKFVLDQVASEQLVRDLLNTGHFDECIKEYQRGYQGEENGLEQRQSN